MWDWRWRLEAGPFSVYFNKHNPVHDSAYTDFFFFENRSDLLSRARPAGPQLRRCSPEDSAVWTHSSKKSSTLRFNVRLTGYRSVPPITSTLYWSLAMQYYKKHVDGVNLRFIHVFVVMIMEEKAIIFQGYFSCTLAVSNHYVVRVKQKYNNCQINV